MATYVPDRRLYLLNTATGRRRWRVVTAASDLPTTPLITATSVIGAEGGVSGFPRTRLVSRAAATGRVQWSRRLTDSPFGALQVLGSDAVVQTNPDQPGKPSPLMSYRLATGAVAWQANMPTFVTVAPVLLPGNMLVQPSDLLQACAVATDRAVVGPGSR